MDKLFDKLPYDTLKDIKFMHFIACAVGIGFIVIAVYYFTLFAASKNELKELLNKKKNVEQTLKGHRATVKNRDMAEKGLAMVSGQLDAYKKQMQIVDTLPDLLHKVSRFGENRKIELLNYELKEGSINDFYKEIPLKIRLQGDLWSTLDFFEYMQNLIQLVSFENLTLDTLEVPITGPKGPTGKNVHLLQTAITAKAYSFIEGSDKRPVSEKITANKNAKNEIRDSFKPLVTDKGPMQKNDPEAIPKIRKFGSELEDTPLISLYLMNKIKDKRPELFKKLKYYERLFNSRENLKAMSDDKYSDIVEAYRKVLGQASKMKVPKTPLQAEYKKLRLTGTISKNKKFLALVETLDQKGYVVDEGKLIGPMFGFVQEVQAKRIIVIEKSRNYLGNILTKQRTLEFVKNI